ncbi:MAG: hypothetical protein JO131_00365 [Gammaproteobacteria bacterium]|nr:hypothetical protein [Gammaproteobacteria bacterium]
MLSKNNYYPLENLNPSDEKKSHFSEENKTQVNEDKETRIDVFERLNHSHQLIEAKLNRAHNTVKKSMRGMGIAVMVVSIIFCGVTAKDVPKDSSEIGWPIFSIFTFLLGLLSLANSYRPHSCCYRGCLKCSYKDHQGRNGNSYLNGNDLTKEEKDSIVVTVKEYHAVVEKDVFNVSIPQNIYVEFSDQLRQAALSKQSYYENNQKRGEILLNSCHTFFPAPVANEILNYLGCPDSKVLLKKYRLI